MPREQRLIADFVIKRTILTKRTRWTLAPRSGYSPGRMVSASCLILCPIEWFTQGPALCAYLQRVRERDVRPPERSREGVERAEPACEIRCNLPADLLLWAPLCESSHTRAWGLVPANHGTWLR